MSEVMPVVHPLIDGNNFEPAKIWEAYKIDLLNPVPPPEPIIIQSDTDITLIHRKNISTIAASAKVGKTFLISAIAAAAMNEDGYLGFHCPKSNVKVLFIDTEQDISDTQNVVKRVHKINNWDISNNKDVFVSLNLREIDSEKRREVIGEAIKDLSPDLVMLDGIVDLLNDFNNIEQSKQSVDLLTSWSSKYDCHIMTCLHVNKDKEELRGHLGAFLRQKGELTLRLDKRESDPPYIEAKSIDSRHRPIENFCFRINTDALLELYYPEPKKPANKKSECFFSEILGISTMSYTDLKNAIMSKADIGEKGAEAKISRATKSGIIAKTPSNYYHIPSKTDQQDELPF